MAILDKTTRNTKHERGRDRHVALRQVVPPEERLTAVIRRTVGLLNKEVSPME